VTERCRAALQAHFQESYAGLWANAFAQAFGTEHDHQAWLLGPSGYLLSADGLRFGLDICIHRPWIEDGPRDSLAGNLSRLDFMLLSHEHADHYDEAMLRLLKDAPVRWFVPAFFDRGRLLATGISPERITWVEPGQTYQEGSLAITAFESPHVNVPELGYLVETGKARLLFPGDVRDYTQGLPAFGPVDCLFAHVWLGRDNARNLPCEPWLSGFCDFAAALRPRRVFLTHLFELGRDAGNLWTYSHAGLAADGLLERDASMQIAIPRIGEALSLG
jgi:L-ascorbate metabolism protein UlaG (beta-lactamase superfamily)